MGNVFMMVFLPAWLCAVLWVFLKPRFTRRLHEHHLDIYQSLGSPPLGYQRTYTGAEISALFSEIGYILKGGFRTVEDQGLERLGNLLRLIFIACLALLMICLGLVATDIGGNSQCGAGGKAQLSLSVSRTGKAGRPMLTENGRHIA